MGCCVVNRRTGEECAVPARWHLLVDELERVTFLCAAHLVLGVRALRPIDIHSVGPACPVPRAAGGRWFRTGTLRRPSFCYVEGDDVALLAELESALVKEPA